VSAFHHPPKKVPKKGAAPSRAGVRRRLGPVRLRFRHLRQKGRPGDLRSALPDTNGMRRCLRLAGEKSGKGGSCTRKGRRPARLPRAGLSCSPTFPKKGFR